MRQFDFATVDVFTSHPLEGNQLAVFPDARGLTDGEMLAIAREFNYAESTFVLRRDQPTEKHRISFEDLPTSGAGASLT